MIQYQDWPAIPTDLIDSFLTTIKSRELQHTYDQHGAPNTSQIIWEKSIGLPLENAATEHPNSAKFVVEYVTDEIKNWVMENIPVETYEVHVQMMYGGDYIFPHIDSERTIAYNYLIEADSNTVTCFYNTKDEFKDFTLYPNTYIPYYRVDKISEDYIDMYKWHKLDVHKIHSVENLNTGGHRIAITLSIL